MLHLAQTEEGVVATIGRRAAPPGRPAPAAATADERMELMVAAERSEPAVVFERWRVARRAALAALRAADPERPVAWAAWPLKPATLATTRLAEHWAHALDIVEPLAIPFPDTDRLRHIAWLGHGTLPYAFGLARRAGPGGALRADGARRGRRSGRFGPAGRRVHHHRRRRRVLPRRRPAAGAGGLGPGHDGPYGAAALAVLRNYAA